MFSGEQASIENYFEDFSKGSEEWKEMKIMVLGHGCIGKTSLINVIQHMAASGVVEADLSSYVYFHSPVYDLCSFILKLATEGTVGAVTNLAKFSDDSITVSILYV